MDQIEKNRAIQDFVERWKTAEGNEDREARSFLIEFLTDVLGIENPTRVLDFERRVKGRKVDAFYEDMGILIEAKSRKPGILDEQRNNGKYGFETPYQQAKWYANELPSSVKPRWIIVTDFDEFRIHDLEMEYPERDYLAVKLEDLPEQKYLFDFFFDTSQSRLVKEKELSVEAGEIVGKLYDAFSEQYMNLDDSPEEQRSLNVLIVRLVFLLYAEDAGLFSEHQAFYKYMEGFNVQQSRQALLDLFKMLDTPEDERDPYSDSRLLSFPYVNGSLFSDETIIVPRFTNDLRVELLLNASRSFDWKDISPTIFGAVFESTLNPETRRAGGMHYTSIENIHKVIDPLFLDDLKMELAKIEGEKVERKRLFALREFQEKLASINILDPACGSGNFLTESYIQLRRLENRVLEDIQGTGQSSLGLDGDADPVRVSIRQFYGIEINDFAVSVAKAALWIAESQMLTETQNVVRRYIDYFPLTTNAHIVEGNALRMAWGGVLPAEECTYALGNPPFLGARMQSKRQKEDLKEAFHNAKNCGNVDYVAGWYIKAAEYMGDYSIRTAFVSTNSICQGEQVASIWELIHKMGFHIDFAYDTFRWRNEANDQANVFVVIVGFSKQPVVKVLFHHESPDSEPEAFSPRNINAYLKDAPNVLIWNRSQPICNVPRIGIGNKPIDGGNYLFSEDEMREFLRKEPDAERYFRSWLGSQEFINGKSRYVLWMGDTTDEELENLPLCKERVEAVRQVRLNSSSAPTRKIANTPKRFHVENMPDDTSILVPRVSSERRKYIPIGFITPDIFCSDASLLIPNATLYHYGVLQSQFHNAWMRTVAGRLKSDYRYSGGVVYNNFIWPNPNDAQKVAIEEAAQAVLDARNSYPGKSLAELYAPDKMPSDLLTAHKVLDKAVENAYGVDFHGDEDKIVAHLFKLYAEATKNEN